MNKKPEEEGSQRSPGRLIPHGLGSSWLQLETGSQLILSGRGFLLSTGKRGKSTGWGGLGGLRSFLGSLSNSVRDFVLPSLGCAWWSPKWGRDCLAPPSTASLILLYPQKRGLGSSRTTRLRLSHPNSKGRDKRTQAFGDEQI